MSNRQSILEDITAEVRKLRVEGSEREEAIIRIAGYVDELDRMEAILRAPIVEDSAQVKEKVSAPRSLGPVVKTYPAYDWHEWASIPLPKEVEHAIMITVGWAIFCIFFALAALLF